jgi:hypothetical protein
MNAYRIPFFGALFLSQVALAQIPETPENLVVDTTQDNYSLDEFNKANMGQSHHTSSFEFNLGGGLANVIYAPSFGYNWIFQGGHGQINIPLTLWFSRYMPENIEGGNQKFKDPMHLLIGSGLRLRYFHDQIDEGLLYGGGLKINYWQIGYQIDYQNRADSTVSDISLNVIPHGEVGYLYPIEQVRNLYAQGLAEIGWSLVQESLEGSSNLGTVPFNKSRFYWNLNVGLTYAF